jgi:hypothetical protein
MILNCRFFYTPGLTAVDFQCRLAWDVHFSGSIVSTIGFQTITSLLFIIFFSVDLAMVDVAYLDLLSASILVPSDIVAIVSSVIIFGYTARAWYRRPERRWKLGVKEISHSDHGTTRFTQSKLSLFGTRRRPDDSIRKIWPEAGALLRSAFIRGLKRLRTSLKLAILRKTMYVERNCIIAIYLISSFIGKSKLWDSPYGGI